MDANEIRCKGCGIVFDIVDSNIDKCAGKRLFCELCLAQKAPRSVTEQKIKKKYLLITASSAVIALIMFIAVNWEKSKNENLLEYLVGYGFGLLLIWIFLSILLLPVFMLMKKPHKKRIKEEKEKYVEEIEKKKTSRKTVLQQQEKAKTEANKNT